MFYGQNTTVGGLPHATRRLDPYFLCYSSFIVSSSIGVGIVPMTSQNGGQDGGHGSNPSPVKGYDLWRPGDAFGVTSEGELTP